MLDYIVKFNKLPKELRDQVSTPTVMAALDEIEAKYAVSLVETVMLVMIKELSFNDMVDYLAGKFDLSEEIAGMIKRELTARVFFLVADYLGINAEAILKTPVAENVVGNQPASSINNITSPADVRGSSFFFSADDEKEIRSLTQNVPIPNRNISGEQVELLLNKLLEEIKISFGSEALIDRFRQILRTYIKGVRNKIDTKFSLSKPYEAGGLGFDEDSINRVLSIADQLIKSVPAAPAPVAPPKIRVPEDEAKNNLASLKVIGARDIEYDLATELKKIEQAKIEKQAAKPVPPVASKPNAPRSEIINKADLTKPFKMPEVPKKNTNQEKIIIKRPLDATSRIKIEDVKYVPKTMAPIDELRNMDLTSFRRLDKDPLRAVAKIKEKIELLEEEQYSKRLEAIKAWRLSPINRLYLNLGELSISQNKPIEIILQNMRASGEDHLNSQEFEAIMNLNRELRF